MGRHVRLDEAGLRALADAYKGGLTVRGLASERGWSYGATHRRLQEAEELGLVRIRSRGFRPANRSDDSGRLTQER